MSEAVTIPVELSVGQLIQAIRQLPSIQRREVLEALEDLFFGALIADTDDDEMLSRDAAIAYAERLEAHEAK